MSPLPSVPPPALPDLAANDHTQWFKQEVQPHGGPLKSYLLRAFPSVRDVDDVVQESYLRIWKARAAQPIRSGKAFLFTVARRLALDLIRRDRASPFIPVKEVTELFVLDSCPDASQAANQALEMQLLVEAIDSLPLRCREIFILCQVEGLPHKEVAARLGISEITVSVQFCRGLQRCEAFVRQRLSAR